MTSHNNVIVCSKNRHQKNTTASFVDVKLNTPLQCGENEFFTVDLCSLNMIKSFYAIQTNLNNKFSIILEKTGGEADEIVLYIPDGNYDVRTLLKTLQDLCFGLITVQYDRRLNKFIYARQDLISDGAENIIDYDIYIKPIDCGAILGLDNNSRKLIDAEPTFSDYFVNISGYSSLIVKLDGVSITNSYINFTSQKYDISKMLAIIDLSQVSPMDSITYTKNDNDCNKYKISEKLISQFSLEIVNEDNLQFPQMSDYIINLVFQKHKNDLDTTTMFYAFMDRFNDLIYYITYLFQYLGIIQ